MIKAHHGFRNRNSIRPFLFLSALAGVSLNATAAVDWMTQARGQALWNAAVHGRTTNIGIGEGAMLTVKPLNSGGWTPAGNYGVAAGTNGAVRVGLGSEIPIAGKTVPVDITGSLGKEVIAGAVGGCLTGSIVGCALGTLTPLAIAWMGTSGLMKDPEGSDRWGIQEGGSGFVWYHSGTNITASGPAEVAAAVSGASDCYLADKVNLNTQVWSCSGYGGVTIIRKEGGTSGTWNPATSEQIKAALIKAGHSDPRIVPELANAGVDWNKRWPGYDSGASTPDGGMAAPKIIGPASIKGDTTTTTNSDGSRTTTTTSTPITYGPGTATAGPTSSTTTVTNSDGTTRSTSTTTTTPGDGTPTTGTEEEKPVDPCDEHPERVGCLDIDVPEGKIPKETKNVTFTPSELPGIGGGQCPADVSMSFTAAPGIGAAKIINWRSFCDMALPLRAIVMALASIMAFFIVMPGGRVE